MIDEPIEYPCDQCGKDTDVSDIYHDPKAGQDLCFECYEARLEDEAVGRE